jgi:hypothetical protein
MGREEVLVDGSCDLALAAYCYEVLARARRLRDEVYGPADQGPAPIFRLVEGCRRISLPPDSTRPPRA